MQMSDRVFSEKEVAVILERAAELQALSARERDHRPGLTLAELESVAADAGLDPQILRQAAAEVDHPRSDLLRRNSGMTAAHVFVERRVRGTLTPEHWEDVVAELRHHFESDLASMMGMGTYGAGTTEQIGRTLEWRHTSMSGIETKVMLRPRGDEIDVKLRQRVGWASPPAEGSSYALILSIIFGMFGGGVLDSALFGAALFVLVLLAAVPLIIYADGSWRKKKLRELEKVADRVTSIVATRTPEAVRETAATAPEPLATESAPEARLAATESAPVTESAPEAESATKEAPPSRIESPSMLDEADEPVAGRVAARVRDRGI